MSANLRRLRFKLSRVISALRKLCARPWAAKVRRSAMAHRSRDTFLAALFSLFAAACASDTRGHDERAAIRTMRAETLARLFVIAPESSERIRHAAGFAVFAGPEMQGVMRDNSSGAEIFTRLSAATPAPAADDGARLVVVFAEPLAMHRFRGLDRAAHAGQGAMDLAPGVTLYRLDVAGPLVQAAVDPAKVAATGGGH
jgi:hypothetical protein